MKPRSAAYDPQKAANEKAWRQKNRERFRGIILKTRYGIDEKWWQEQNAAQNGACGICLRVPRFDQRKLCVDHDHRTGKARGLLCFTCNAFLGHLEKLGDAGWTRIVEWRKRG